MRKIFIPAAAVAALAIAGCGSDNGGSGGGGYGSGNASTSGKATPQKTTATPVTAVKPAVDVTISNFKFDAPAVAVKTGGTVTWTNKDSAQHTATADKGANTFDTGTLSQGDSKKVTFSKAGTYAYICSFHPFMKGTVVVQ
jgi:amicyanin